MRYTPKLLALDTISQGKRTSSKEAIHKFYSMYCSDDSSNLNDKFETNRDSNMPRLHKSVTLTSLFKTDNSTISANSVKSAKILNKVKFITE